MHPRPAHLLERHLLADHHLGHPRRAKVHRRVALAHDHHVAERGDIGAAGGRGAEEQTELRHAAREPDLVVEDPPRAAAARKHRHLVGDPCPGRVHQVDHRQLERQSTLLDAEDLLDRLRPPGSCLDGRVVGHQANLAPADQRQAGDHPVGAEALRVPVRQQGLLGEGLGIHQPLEPLANWELALLGGLQVMALRAARQGGGERALEFASGASLAHPRGVYERRRPEEVYTARSGG